MRMSTKKYINELCSAFLTFPKSLLGENVNKEAFDKDTETVFGKIMQINAEKVNAYMDHYTKISSKIHPQPWLSEAADVFCLVALFLNFELVLVGWFYI